MRTHRAGFVLALTAATTLGASAAAAAAPARTAGPQTQATVYSSFPDFVRSLSSARAESYVRRQPDSVQDANAFEQMRNHLLKLYSGVVVKHSFDLSGDTFDCVPLMQQPAMRLSGVRTIAAPPPASPLPPAIGPAAIDTQVTHGTRDAFGGLQACARGTIPVRRLTLDNLSRFPTLRAFFRKSPNGGDSLPPYDPNGHSYAIGIQNVKNWGARN